MSLSWQLWWIVEDYQVLSSLTVGLIYPEHKESPVSLGGNWKDALTCLMAIAEANHMHFMARNNCISGISVCALWPCSTAMFDYPSGCVRIWMLLYPAAWLRQMQCHRFVIHFIICWLTIQSVFDRTTVWQQQLPAPTWSRFACFSFLRVWWQLSEL